MAAAAQQSAATGRQLLQAEGLAQHIIGAGIQQRHHWLRAGAGREHHHRTMELARQSQGGGFLQQFGAYQQIRGLLLTDFDGLAGRCHRRRQMSILSKTLGQNRSQGRMGINHKHPAGLAAIVRRRGLHHADGELALVDTKVRSPYRNTKD
jgi:hypothetical protein